MTTDEALEKVRAHVQWCREEGENDLRSILSMIKYLRDDIAKESALKAAERSDERILKAYLKQCREWEGKTVAELHEVVGKIMEVPGLTTEQSGLIGIALAILEKHGLNKKIGDLSLEQ